MVVGVAVAVGVRGAACWHGGCALTVWRVATGRRVRTIGGDVAGAAGGSRESLERDRGGLAAVGRALARCVRVAEPELRRAGCVRALTVPRWRCGIRGRGSRCR